MTATLAFDESPFDRRALLRAGVLGGAVLVVTAAEATGATHVIDRLAHGTERAAARRPATASPVLPSAAAWSALVGHEVILTGDRIGRSTAHLVELRDVAHPSPHVRMTGDAYAVRFAIANAPDESSMVVTVHHERLDAPTLVMVPVNGDGSWEAVVDRRTPTIAP